MPPPAARRSRRRLPVTVLTAVLAAVTLGAPSPASASDTAGEYLIGRGISDVTGEAAETGMMGYSSFDQKTSGIHQRQRSRAFVVVDRASGKRVVYVNADLAMIFQSVRQGVLARLKERYGSLYGEENVLLSATHTTRGRAATPTTSPTTSPSSASRRRPTGRSWTASPTRSPRRTRT